jgi:hypothetical protein
MRTNDIFTIKNEYPQKGHFWIFKPEDDTYGVSYDHKVDELSQGEQKMVEIDKTEVKVGFRKDDDSWPGKKGWWAAPTKVKTDRSVRITHDGKIEQSAVPEFPDRSEFSNVNFMDFANDKIHDTARTIVLAGLGKIPVVGGVVEGVVGYIWPESKPTVENLISQSEARMRAWVHGQIQAYDREQLRARLAGLRENLAEYTRAKDPEARKRWFDTCLGFFNYSKGFFLRDSIDAYTPGTIGLAFDLATMHLALLRERVAHTKDIYGNEVVDLAAFKKNLKDNIAAYQKFIKDVAIPGEIRWRNGQMEVISGYVRDYVARQVNQLSHDVLIRYYQNQALRSYETALQANVGDPAMLWTLLDPDQANVKPIPMDRVWWVGPCTGLTQKSLNEHHADDKVRIEDKPGLIKKIYVREWNEVDYLQFFYEGHDGGGFGNKSGGTEHTIEVPQGVFVNRVETWWDWELSGIKFYFTDGRDTGMLGNRDRGSNQGRIGRHVESAAYPGHRLSTIRMDYREYGMKSGPNGISFGFSPLPDYYNPKP